MAAKQTGAPVRPKRTVAAPLPSVPEIGTDDPEHMSTVFSHYRTGLSHHRTELSEHRTDLSEYRTDLSGERTELSMRRTGMSFQRTRMSADRTLMSVIRTSLSLIGFGFTIAQAFEKLRDSGAIRGAGTPRNFGLALVCVGILVLIGGLWRDLAFALELRGLRRTLVDEHLLHGQSRFPLSLSFFAAVALLFLGFAAVAVIGFHATLS